MTLIRRRIQNIKNILSMEQTEILQTALFAMIPVILTKITGQVFNLLAASSFGTKSVEYNQFLLASSIPDLISNVLIIGSVGAVVIPTLVSAKKKEGEEAFLRVYNVILNWSLLIFGILSLAIFLTAHVFMPWYLGTFAGENFPTPDQMSTIIDYLRVLMLPQIILAMSVFMSSGINIYNRYLVPQLSPLFFNLGRIFGLVVLIPVLGGEPSPWAVILGVYIGSILHLLVQIPLARYLGLKYMLVFWYRGPYVKELLRISIPRMFAVASEHVALTINDAIAFGVKAVTTLNFANSLSLVVPQLFAFTFAYASFPKLSEHYEDKDYKGIVYIVNKTFNEMIFLALPFIVTLLIMRVPVVRLTFGLKTDTALDLDGTYQIAWVLLWFAVGHVFVIGKWYMYRLYYATKETLIPFVVSLFSLILNVVLALVFTNLFSHNAEYAITATNVTLENLSTRGTGMAAVGGISLGMSVAYTLEFFALILIFNYKKFSLELGKLFKSLVPKFIAGGAMFVTMYLMFKTWNVLTYAIPTSTGNFYRGSTTINLFLLSFITISTSFMVYYLVSHLLKLEELRILRRYLNPIFRLGGLRL